MKNLMKRFVKFITKVNDDMELQRFTKRSKKNGENVSLKRVQRRMTILGIKSVVVKKYKPVKV